jgi:catechol 2,3-dioxygenase-like lactoylglutathione lyase family enzyme
MAETQAELGQDQSSLDVFAPRKAPAGPASPDPADPAPSTGAALPSAAPVSAEPVSAAPVSPVPVSAAPVSPEPADPGLSDPSVAREPAAVGAIHHVELWVPDLDRAVASWGWLLTALGYRDFQDWPGGRSWRSGHAYIVVEQSPARTAGRHDRCRPGLNHLAFHVGSREHADELTQEAQLHGWKLMFSELHPFAGGPQHYAAYLENADGFEVELVAG